MGSSTNAVEDCRVQSSLKNRSGHLEGLLTPIGAGAVIATLLMLVAVATPSTGVTSVGVVANTMTPVPVSSEITPFSCNDVVAANCDNGLVVKASPPPGRVVQTGGTVVPPLSSACPTVPLATG